jgi:hypothetical protein
MPTPQEFHFALFPASGWECLLGGLLPPLLAAEPLQRHFQVEPGNEILEGFWLKLTRMTGCPPHKNFIEIWYGNYRIFSLFIPLHPEYSANYR